MRDEQARRAMIKDAKRYIDAHLNETLDLEALAARYDCSYTAFRRAFVEIGKPYAPHQYIRLRCVQKAAQYIREGHNVTEAVEYAGFTTRGVFFRAFKEIMGIGPQEFLSSRGMALMEPPVLKEIKDFFIVGYVLKKVDDMQQDEYGAYWIVKEFPDVSTEEYLKIGGGADMAAIWAEGMDGEHYVMGPPVEAVQYVPEQMEAVQVSGGLFLEFPIPGPSNTFLLYENVRVTWYFAREQWLPDSPWEEDSSRRAYEYYGVDRRSVMIPVKEKHVEK